MKKICVIGGINIDLVSLSSRFPNPGETLLGEDFNIFPGGKGANQAVAVGNLGGLVTCIGKVGDDAFSKVAIDNLKDSNVGVKNVEQGKDISTGVAVIEVTASGENSIVFIPGANMQVDVDLIERNIEALEEADSILMQMEIAEETIKYVADYAKQNNKVFVLDPAPAKVLDKDLLKNISIITPNETEMKIVTGHDVNDTIDIEKAAQGTA